LEKKNFPKSKTFRKGLQFKAWNHLSEEPWHFLKVQLASTIIIQTHVAK